MLLTTEINYNKNHKSGIITLYVYFITDDIDIYILPTKNEKITAVINSGMYNSSKYIHLDIKCEAKTWEVIYLYFMNLVLRGVQFDKIILNYIKDMIINDEIIDPELQIT